MMAAAGGHIDILRAHEISIETIFATNNDDYSALMLAGEEGRTKEV